MAVAEFQNESASNNSDELGDEIEEFMLAQPTTASTQYETSKSAVTVPIAALDMSGLGNPKVVGAPPKLRTSVIDEGGEDEVYDEQEVDQEDGIHQIYDQELYE